MEICRDTNAAINILKKGMKVLGVDWNNSEKSVGTVSVHRVFQDSTFGQKESASNEEKPGENTASTIDGQLDIASELL